MRKLLTILSCVVLATIKTALAVEEPSKISLDYCPTTPTATDVKGRVPSSVTAKYGPWLDKEIKPYVGLGVGYSMPAPLEKPGDNPEGPKAGAAGQAGISYNLSKHAKVDLDYRYLYLSPDLTHGGNTSAPQLVGVRLGCDF
jgi:outer membrane protein W